jgi:hypothetical protein
LKLGPGIELKRERGFSFCLICSLAYRFLWEMQFNKNQILIDAEESGHAR